MPAAIKVHQCAATDVSVACQDFFEICQICDLPKTTTDKFIYNQPLKCGDDFYKTFLKFWSAI